MYAATERRLVVGDVIGEEREDRRLQWSAIGGSPDVES